MDTNLSQPSQAHCHTVTLACQKFSILHSSQFGKNIKFYDTPPPPPPTTHTTANANPVFNLVFSRLNIVILKIVQIIIIKYPKPFQGSVCVSAAMQHHLLHCEASVPSQFSVVCSQLFSHSQEDIHRNKSFWKPETIINKPERNCCWIVHNFK